jgi:phosphoserine aminotransferase
VEAGSSKDSNYSFIPKQLNIPSDADYLHFTSNNTIFGTQFQQFPKTNLPLVCDMSSDIFSRVIDAKQFDLIYAGAQKNMGPAGTTVYIVKKSALGKSSLSIPTMLDLQTHAKAESMFNTPPVFAVYVSMLVLRWIKKTGLVQIEKNNTAKANLLYGEIDRSSVFKGTAAVEDRSKMNITFVLNDGVDVAHEETFLNMCKTAKVDGLKGHRSVGGFRASCYNALPLESVQALVDVMQEFENKVK